MNNIKERALNLLNIDYNDELKEYIVSKMVEFSEIQNKKLLEFKESFIKDFETDFLLDGEIVDNPNKRWSCLPNLYKQAKNI